MEPQTPLALPPEHKNNRKFIIIVASLFVLIVLIMVVIGFVVFNNPCFEENYLGYELGPKCAYSLKPYNVVESSSDVSNWKTYRNEQYGFEFKYPKDWTIDGKEDLFRVIDMQDLNKPYKGIYVSITDSNGMNIDKWLENYNTEFIDSKSKLIINGNSVVKSINSADGSDGFSYYFSDNKNVFKFEVSKFYQNGNSFYDYDKYIIKILSTFKFFNSTTTDISNWNTYRNEEYGFEFKYPVFNDPYIEDIEIDNLINNQDILFRMDVGVDNGGLSRSLTTFSIIKNTSKLLVFGGKKIAEKESIINNIKWTIFDYEYTIPTHYSFYRIVSHTVEDVTHVFYIHPENNQEFFDKILSTFKFIK